MTATDLHLLLGVVIGSLMTIAVGLVVLAAARPPGRPLPRSTGRHRRVEDPGWFFEREEDVESPSPLPVGVFGFTPTEPRGIPNWHRQLTEPMPMIGGRR